MNNSEVEDQIFLLCHHHLSSRRDSVTMRSSCHGTAVFGAIKMGLLALMMVSSTRTSPTSLPLVGVVQVAGATAANPPLPPPPPTGAKSSWFGSLLSGGNDRSAGDGDGADTSNGGGGDNKDPALHQAPPSLPASQYYQQQYGSGGSPTGWFTGGPPPPPMPFVPRTQDDSNNERAQEGTPKGGVDAAEKQDGNDAIQSGEEQQQTMPPPPPPLPLQNGGHSYWGSSPGTFGMPPPLPQQQQQHWGQTQQQAQYEDWEAIDPYVALQSELEETAAREAELLYQVSNLTASLGAARDAATGRLHTIDVLTERISETEARAASESNAALELRANCTNLAKTVQQLQEEASAREERCALLEEQKACDVKLLNELRDEIRKKQSELEDLACAIEEDRADAERERYLEEIRQRRKKRGFFGTIFGAIFGKGYDEEEERAKAQELARSTLIHALQVERSNVDELEASLLILQQNNSAISDMVESRDHLINELNDRVSVFEEDKIVLKAALRQLQKEMKEEAPKTQKIVSDLKKAQEEIKHLHSISKKAKSKHSDQVERLSAQIQSRDTHIKDSESKMSTIAHYVDQLEERLASFAIAKKEIGVREEKCKELEEMDEKQKEKIVALQTQVADLATEKDEMKSLIDLLVEERGILQKEKAKLEKKIRKLEEQTTSLERQVGVKEEEIANLGRDLNESKRKLHEAEQTIEKLEESVASFSDQLAEVERISEENRVEAAEQLTIAEELSSQQQQKIEELFSRVAAAEAPPPPPPLPGMVSDDSALDQTSIEEQTDDGLSDSSSLSQPLVTKEDAQMSGTQDFPPSYHEPTAATGGRDTYYDNLDDPSQENFFDAPEDDNNIDDNGEKEEASELGGKDGNEDAAFVSEGVQVAEAIMERFDKGNGDASDILPYPEKSMVEGVMKFDEEVEEDHSDRKDEDEEDDNIDLAIPSAFGGKSPPSLPTSAGQPPPRPVDGESPPPASRNVPFRQFRKAFSKATGIHGVFTPPSRPRKGPPRRSGKASFGLKPKPPQKKESVI